MNRAEALQERHERLLFSRAYPRNAAELRKTLAALERLARQARPLRDQLENSGIAGTLYRYPFNHAMTRWLAERYGPAVEIDWSAYKKHEWDEIAAMLSLCVAWAENEGLDDDDVPSWDWIRRARGRRGGTDLSWLLAALRRAGFAPELERHLFESLNLPLVWDLSDTPDASTWQRLPVARVFYHRRIDTARPPDFAAAIRAFRAPLDLLSPARADRVIHAARAALSQREREFHVIVHANREETYRFAAGRGLEIYVFGLVPGLRLTLEADYGALLVKNGVPIGYGYAVLLFDRADIAINIFPTWRSGESAFTFGRFASLFHQHFGARDLIMRRYQLGWQNPEGIEAGSFWFYHKLGFRPVDPRVRALAAAEADRLARRRGARSGPPMLRRLARSDLVLRLDGGSLDAFRDIDVKRVGLAVTRLVESRFGGDRGRALDRVTRSVAAALGVPRIARVRPRLAPVAALIGGLRRWPDADKRRLAAALLAKEGRREGPYVLAMLRAGRFRQALAALTR